MIKCPKCQQTLMDTAQKCQFCGADTRAVPRPVAPAKKNQPKEAPKWVTVCYNLIAVYWVLSGAYGVLKGMGVLGGESSIVGLIGSSILIVVGVGLLARIELVRGVVNVICFVNIVFAVLGALASLPLIMATGLLGVILLVRSIFDFVTSAFMIFLLGETDRRAPNI